MSEATAGRSASTVRAPRRFTALPVAWRFALRELRGGLKGFRIFLACLALGVAAIAAAGSMNRAVQTGLEQDARILLGGDLEIDINYRPPTAEQLAVMESFGRVSRSIEMRAMGRTADDGTLVQLKAVDDAYPLYGALELAPDRPLMDTVAERDGRHGVAVDPALLVRLDLAVGDVLRLGGIDYEIRATIAREPDRANTLFAFGPRVMLSIPGLEASGLIQPGALVEYETRIATDRAAALRQTLEQRFPDAGWQIRGLDRAAPGLERFLGNITLFLTLVGLTALLVGGIGVANAVKAFLDTRINTIATLKCLGASAERIFHIYLIQISLIAALGIVLGLALGGAVPFLAAGFLRDLLPVEARTALYAGPLLQAAGFGILTALVFALWPLSRARRVLAAALFRTVVAVPRGRPHGADLAALLVLAAALAALTVVTAENRGLAAWFVVGSVVTLGLFRLAASGVQALARQRAPGSRGRPGLRLALANLHRPGAPTASVVLSLGLGLTVLVAVAQIESNLTRQINESLPQEAPSFFFIDIQPDQMEPFRRVVEGVEGARILQSADMIRGSIVRLRGEPVNEASVDPEVRWAVRGDRGLSSADRPPANARIVAGQWWPEGYDGPPQLSLARTIAQGLGVGIGDTVTLNVLGREITGTIANLRDVDWGTLEMNFSFILSENTLRGAPRSFIATVEARGEVADRLERAVAAQLPNVSGIRVDQALEAVNTVMGAAGNAVRAVAAVTLLAGALVLAGAIAAGHRRRVYDAVVLKVLGATRRDVLRAFLIEYGILGAATGVIAVAVGSVVGWAVLTFVMRGATWAWAPGMAAGTVVLCIAITLAAGFAGTWRALSVKAAPLLRNE
ncbi:ABC transporter permease [Caenispirillum bisanense]|uniref:ABC transporter permease n=1 Tax=Caenispirillum bisanense TaxID=414052 RepID=UPI0031D7D806